MAEYVIRKGLDLPISGAPEQTVETARTVSRVAVLADDYPFMKPRMHVAVGDLVTRGQLLFEDRKAPGVRFTAPGAGTVSNINRGDRRALISLVIDLSEGERSGDGPELTTFESYSGEHPRDLDREKVRDLLVESGLWTAIRRRPFGTIPSPEQSCASIFITAIDSNPLCADPEKVLEGRMEDFHRGLHALGQLTDGPLHLCVKAGSKINCGDAPRVEVESFKGPHPAGLAGTHIHLVDPVSAGHIVWYAGYQDVVAIGRLFATGVLDPERIVALGGPKAKSPRLLKTRLGAFVDELVEGEVSEGENRVVSGSVLHGHTAMGETRGFLGRFDSQISILEEGRKREFLDWMMPGFDVFSMVRAYASSLIGRSSFDFTTSTRGGHRAMVPIGMFERVMPLDIMPTFLLRALFVDDLERSEALGCLELDEEDLALCSFVSPGKEDFGEHLRRNLLQIWKEG